jgi:hypothetical protein
MCGSSSRVRICSAHRSARRRRAAVFRACRGLRGPASLPTTRPLSRYISRVSTSIEHGFGTCATRCSCSSTIRRAPRYPETVTRAASGCSARTSGTSSKPSSASSRISSNTASHRFFRSIARPSTRLDAPSARAPRLRSARTRLSCKSVSSSITRTCHPVITPSSDISNLLPPPMLPSAASATPSGAGGTWQEARPAALRQHVRRAAAPSAAPPPMPACPTRTRTCGGGWGLGRSDVSDSQAKAPPPDGPRGPSDLGPAEPLARSK